MTTILDRHLLFNYIKSYLICLISFLGLYVIVDVFTNLDEFSQSREGLLPTLLNIARFYGRNSTFIFDRLSEAIVLIAAMFTIAWVQRHNELLPLLSAGVSTRRVLRPVLVGACLFLLLNVANQELLIPILGSMHASRDDPYGEKNIPVRAMYDANGVHLSGKLGTRFDRCVRNMTVVIPVTIANGQLLTLEAGEAFYIPPADEPRSGGWLLQKTTPAELPAGWSRPDVLEMIDAGTYFLSTSEVDFDAMTRDHNKWFYSISTWRLFQELSRGDSGRPAAMAVFFHMRLTRPLLGIILVVMGLSIILRDQNRNVFTSAGLCLSLAALFYVTAYLTRFLGDYEYLPPATAAWLPVFIFGPWCLVQFDAIHT